MSYELLPNEHIKQYIFELLDPRTRIGVASVVCKEWRSYCYKTLKHISFCEHNRKCSFHFPTINDEIMEKLVNNTAKKIQTIHLCHVDNSVTKNSLSHISQCTDLKSFLLCCATVDDEGAVALKQLTKLDSISVCYTKINSLDHFANSTQLKSIKFIPTQVDFHQQNIPILDPIMITSSFPLLTCLDLQDIRFVKPLFPELAKLKDLTYLRIRRSSFPYTHFEELGQCTKLETITLWSKDSVITDDRLRGFSSLTKLKRVRLGPFDDEYFTGAGLSNMSECTDLLKLYLWRCSGLRNEHLVHLGNLHNLIKFSVSHAAIDDGEGFAALAGLPKLEYLWMGFAAGVRPATLISLGNNKSLRELHMSAYREAYSSDVLSAIAKITPLRTISMFCAEGATAHASAGLADLATLPNLESIELHNFDVRADDVIKFQHARSLMNIVLRCCPDILPDEVIEPLAENPVLQQIIMSRPDYTKKIYAVKNVRVEIDTSH